MRDYINLTNLEEVEKGMGVTFCPIITKACTMDCVACKAELKGKKIKKLTCEWLGVTLWEKG